MTDEENSDRKRALIIAAVIFLAISILAGLVWYGVMAERWKSGRAPVQVGHSLPIDEILGDHDIFHAAQNCSHRDSP